MSWSFSFSEQKEVVAFREVMLHGGGQGQAEKMRGTRPLACSLSHVYAHALLEETGKLEMHGIEEV